MAMIDLVSSPDAPGALPTSDLSLCLLTVATMLKVEEKPLPRILVLHVSEPVAAQFGIKRPGVIRHNRCGTDAPVMYYELWIIGAPQVQNYSMGVMSVLEDWFGLKVSDEERRLASDMAVWAVSGGLSDAVCQ